MESPGQHIHPLFMKPHLFRLLLAFLFLMIMGAAVFIGHSHLTDETKKAMASNRSAADFFTRIIKERENAILGVLQSYANRRGLIAAAKDEDQSKAIRHLINLVEINPAIDAVFVTNPKGTLWANFPVIEALHGKNLGDRDWYHGVSQEWRSYVSGVYKRIASPHDLAITVCLPIRDEKDKVIGILGASQSVSWLAQLIQQVHPDPSPHITLLDQRGNIIYSDRIPLEGKVIPFPETPFLAGALQGEKGEIQYRDSSEGNRLKYAAFAPVSDLGWTVIVEKTAGEIWASATHHLIYHGAISILLVLLVAFALGYLRRRFITARMLELRRADETLRQSTLEVKRLSEENAILAEIGRLVTSSLDMKEIYAQFAMQVRNLIPFERLVICLLNSDGETGTIAHMEGPVMADRWEGLVFPLPGTITAHLVLSRSGLIVDADRSEDLQDRFPFLLPSFESGERCFMGVPLLHRDITIGSMIFHATACRAYNESHLRLAERIARQISGAVANAQMFRELKQAQEALRQSEALLRNTFEAIPDLLVVIDREMRVVLSNWHGYDFILGEKRTGRPFCYQVYFQRETPCEPCHALDVFQAGNSEHVELFNPVNQRTREVNAYPVFDGSGNVDLVIEHSRDITERKQQEEAIHRERDRLEMVTENIGAGVAIISQDYRTIWANRVIKQIFGNVEGKLCHLTYNQMDNICPGCGVRMVFEEGLEKAVHEQVGKDANGETIWSEIIATPIKNRDGSVSAVLELVVPITERKNTEEALRQSEENARHLAEENAILAEIGRIISSTLKVEDIYEQFAREVQKLVPFDRISLNLLEPDEEIGRVAYAAGTVVPGASAGEMFPFKGSFISELKESRSALFFHPSSEEEMEDLFPGLKVNYQEGLRSFLAAPLISGDRVIGSLTFQAKGVQAYRDDHVALAERIANQIAGAIAIARLFAEQERTDELIRASLQEKEVLLKEIHHRVKNNLQVISSLLNLQSKHIKDPLGLEMFRESQNRVKSMGLIHERLYQSKDLARIDFAEYLHNLTNHLLSTYRVNPTEPRIRIEVDRVFLSIDVALPCGLIVNELVSNSLKHAFPPDKEGEVVVRLDLLEESKYLLQVQDNGIGFPTGLDFRTTESLGLQLVNTLVRQLNGEINLRREEGTAFMIQFSAE